MNHVVDRMSGDGTFRAFVARIRSLDAHSRESQDDMGVVAADGLWGCFAPLLATALGHALQRPILYVTAHLDQADEARDEIELFTGRTPELLSAFETVTGEGSASDEIHAERVALCARLHDLASASSLETDAGPAGRGFRTDVPPAFGGGRDARPPGERVAATHRRDAGATPTGGPGAGTSAGHGGEPSCSLTVVAPVQALMQAVPRVDVLEKCLLTLSVGDRRDPRHLADWLIEQGYTRLDQVESPGDFALRGDILDIFPPAEEEPYRVDFFDETIESIRRFDVSTQRSSAPLERVRLATVRGSAMLTDPRGGTSAEAYGAAAARDPGGVPRGHRMNAARRSRGRFAERVNVPHTHADDTDQAASPFTSFLSYLPGDTLVVLADPVEIAELGTTFWNRLGAPRAMMPVDRLLRRARSFTQVHLHPLPGADVTEPVSFGVRSLTRFETRPAEALGELARLCDEREVILYCDNEPERDRFRELWSETVGPLPERLALPIGLIHRGFDWPGGGMAVVGHHEVFHRYQQRRRIRKAHAARPLDSWLDLETGDHVVHLVHGIARFIGMRTMRKGKSEKSQEYLTLEFAEGARLHVPVNQIDLVQKYIGAGGIAPRLSKLGGNRWARTKERVEESVSDLAADLLRIQATRNSQAGIAFPEDTVWQREFEGSFIYTETEDQLTTLAEIKRDMTRPRPMDRLLCGDVGYGKTELAIRAAFKAVEYGRQVAVLVPTTVLAEQHERTFRERLADYPFSIESLSRFKTTVEQRDIIARARKGQVDILIGTHRILSKDVGFSDLGLLVIDEEQRFGVEHKERLKRFRETIDVLTLTATPIPRTLHMSLLGIRDISALATPPLDRRAIATRVCRWDEQLIREAILRELNRDGQVFFVHNFVHDIQSFADTVRRIVPEARILIGHGQMKERELEKVMLQFVRHEADVLVSTTIIESGLDIPNCNTMLIDRADRFGLSELHQLRGRVGRYKHRAYCYLLLGRDRPITPTAAKRLKAIEEYSDLGAGFRIAMRDLEIRGAGNILGSEQSGHIAAVGYELYCQLLDQAVRRLRDEPEDTFRPVHLELDVPAHIPRSYIDSDRQRMEIYRRLVRCRTRSELDQLERDIRDAFGPHPKIVQTLLDLAEIRILAQPFGIRSITQAPPDLIFGVDSVARVEPLFEHSPGSARIADPHTIHLRLGQPWFEPGTMLAVLRRMLQRDPARHTMPAS